MILVYGDWIGLTGNRNNTRSTPPGTPVVIVSQAFLQEPSWTQMSGNVSASPTIEGNTLYWVSWNGDILSQCRDTGIINWRKNIYMDFGYILPNNDTSDIFVITTTRASPLVYENNLIIFIRLPADILVLDKNNGKKKWSLNLHPHPWAMLTSTGTLEHDKKNSKWYLYQGVSSAEEAADVAVTYTCCSFVGTFHKIDLSSRSIVWTWSAIQPATIAGLNQFSGAAIWGSSPLLYNGNVYFATGNNYQIPDEYAACLRNASDDMESQRFCNEPYPQNFFDSVVGLKTTDGSLVWGKRMAAFDVFTIGCAIRYETCPDLFGPDFDFGMDPALGDLGNGSAALFIGQKSGQVFAINPDNGNIFWHNQIGPGGGYGGSSWGFASNQDTLYFSLINSDQKVWTLISPAPGAEQNKTRGGWVALSKSTGHILWQQTIPIPTYENYDPSTLWAVGPPALSGEVLFVTSFDSTYSNATRQNGGTVYTINANTGAIISSYETGSNIYGGFSLSGSCAYVGTGYVYKFNGDPKLFAFCFGKPR